ncbi:Hsp70 family protein [Actinoplanes couchii]|uniref:Molecular chaperone DnaK n=1 Tax=Actinoplanes couchii TaxID=403638 RepID=A0ABQ3WZS9_9ACTN|nr:Hsp70 family protein [Actinoplanes couchii]MDR6316178.1 molecular chaperone DnaK (HSP70) [Actinoplanes couchii]GID51793.1 molecular chaperone DnaK [Actinoplanes couchii]
MSDEMTFLGIDLGTTYSVVTYIDETGRPSVIRNVITNTETTPSVVYFEEESGEVIVGEAARNVARVYPHRVVERVKRSMGSEVQWDFDGHSHSAEAISALILKRLAEDARDYIGREVKQVVITVPAYFGMLERDATRNAGRIAGLDVIGIVPEPVAAALQYEMHRGDQPRTVLVYDLGGGTFDTTVIRISADLIEVLCTDGDQELGGVDWDRRLADHLLTEFIARAEPDGDPAGDEQFLSELQQTAEELKRHLSQATTRKVPIRFGGSVANVEVSRETFEDITRDYLDRTIEYTERTLGKLAAKLTIDDPAAAIDEVLLVGGSSKMPAVRARLTARWPGWQPKLHDPDLAVAKGAARYAFSRSLWDWERSGAAAPTPEEQNARITHLAQRSGVDEDALREMAAKKIVNVLPKSFGVMLTDPTVTPYRHYVEHLVHADEALPSGERVLNARTIEDGQTSVSIEIYEQAGATESPDLDANKAVDHGSGEIGGLPPLKAGSPVDITMVVDDEGLLRLHAVEPSTGKELDIEVRVSILSEAQVNEAKEVVAGITVRS